MTLSQLTRQQIETLFVPGETVFFQKKLAKRTTWKVGGPAECLILPTTNEQVADLLHLAMKHSIPITVLGNGSNVLIKDQGIPGVVICMSKLSAWDFKDTVLWAQAGVLLGKLAQAALQKELTGLEFASSIPASLGGAIRMNAGAWGHSISDLLKSVTYLTSSGAIVTSQREELHFQYRKSCFSTNRAIILSAELEMIPGDKNSIKSKMDHYQSLRKEKQPVELPNAGSVFKNPENYTAGYLIESVGLKGVKIGGAQISEKHANFIVNCGNARSEDIIKLIELTVQTVESFYGIKLEPEVNVIG